MSPSAQAGLNSTQEVWPADGPAAAAEYTGVLAQHLEDLFDPLALIDLVGILGQVRVLATEKTNTQHESCHASAAYGRAPTEEPAKANAPVAKGAPRLPTCRR